MLGPPRADPTDIPLPPPPGQWFEPPKEPIEDKPTLPEMGNEMVIELCCGHAGYTAALAKVGFHLVGIGRNGNKHETVVPVVIADLTTADGQQIIWDLMMSGRAKYVLWGVQTIVPVAGAMECL